MDHAIRNRLQKSTDVTHTFIKRWLSPYYSCYLYSYLSTYTHKQTDTSVDVVLRPMNALANVQGSGDSKAYYRNTGLYSGQMVNWILVCDCFKYSLHFKVLCVHSSEMCK